MTINELFIPDEIIVDLAKKFGRSALPEEIVNEAMTLYVWASQQLADGRYLVTVDFTMQNPIRPTFPLLKLIGAPKEQ